MTSFSDAGKPRHRIVVCRGEYCNIGRRGDKLFARLSAAVDEANAADPLCASARQVNCLDMCAVGPNLIVYPEDAVFNQVDADKLEQVIEKFIRNSGPPG